MFRNIIIVFLAILSLLVSPQRGLSEELQILDLPNTTIKTQIDFFSNLYNTDAVIVEKVIKCESSENHSAVGDGGRSKGIAQFQEPTWKNLEQKYNEEYGEDLNYHSSFDQIKLVTWSIAHGYGNNWTAYRAIKNGGKYSFYSFQLQKHFTIVCR